MNSKEVLIELSMVLALTVAFTLGYLAPHDNKCILSKPVRSIPGSPK